MLPIESSLIGPIAETHDLLYGAPLSIVREATLPIRHCVVGLPGATVEGARVVRSHPAAFEQCRSLLAGWDVRCVPAATTADAAREVAESGDLRQVAIAGLEAAARYELEVVADDVGDRPGAFTRFVALAPYTQVGWARAGAPRSRSSPTTGPARSTTRSGRWPRTGSTSCSSSRGRCPNSPWRYRFDVVLDGHVFDPLVRPAIAGLRAETLALRLFGSYEKERER